MRQIIPQGTRRVDDDTLQPKVESGERDELGERFNNVFRYSCLQRSSMNDSLSLQTYVLTYLLSHILSMRLFLYNSSVHRASIDSSHISRHIK